MSECKEECADHVQELLKQIEQLQARLDSAASNGGFWGRSCARLLKKNNLLKAKLERHRWIPVEERLPKDEYSLLAYGEDGLGYKIVVNTSYNCEFKKFRILSKVTHWKPITLPE